MSKSCFKCGEVKNLDEFYKHSRMGDGHLNKCKTCTKEDVTANRWKNIDRIRAYDRARGSRQSAEYKAEYRARKPNAAKARYMAGNAVRDKKLSKPVLCQFCGSYSPLHGHHRDYSKPLDVQWLCVPCHKRWHIKYGEGLNA